VINVSFFIDYQPMSNIKRNIFHIDIIVDQFNNAQPVNRHFLLLPQQQQQIVQPPSLMYATPAYNFHQPYPVNFQMQQPPLMFVSSRPHLQQSWMLPTPPPPSTTSMHTFISSSPSTFHHIQRPLPPSQSSFSGGTGIPQPSFNRGTSIPQPSFSGGTGGPQSSFSGGPNVSQPSFGGGTGIPQPSFSGGTAVLKRKSHYLEESDFDAPVSFLLLLDMNLQ
jgi:hypothetical protein